MKRQLRLYEDDRLLGTFAPKSERCRIVMDRSVTSTTAIRIFLLPHNRWAVQHWDFDDPASQEVASLITWQELVRDLDEMGIRLPSELSAVVEKTFPDLTTASAVVVSGGTGLNDRSIPRLSKPSSAVRNPSDDRPYSRPSVNARMIDAVQRKPIRRDWSARQWAEFLGCSKSTVHAQPLWKELMKAREIARIHRAISGA